MDRFSRSWELVKQSFAILKSDKELALLPVASAICCVLVSAMVIFGSWMPVWTEMRAAQAAGVQWRPEFATIWLGLFLFYLVNYFVIVFFNVALMSAATELLAGRPATLRGGLTVAWERKGKILQWALLAATVGMILKMIEERVGLLGRIIVRFVGVAWALASYFVAPVLAFENLGPMDALKRSAKLFRETWGEAVISRVSVSFFFGMLMVPGFVLWYFVVKSGSGAAEIALATLAVGVYAIALSVTSAALQGIFTAALYQYAATKTVPPGFDPDSFAMAWTPKEKKF